MDKLLKNALLFDFYGELLTAKQRRAYEMYHNDNLSLAETAEELDISRQGVRDLLKRSEALMLGYERSLALVEKHLDRIKKTEELIREVRSLVRCRQAGELVEIENKLVKLSEV